jgi:hypothetical protein
MWRIVARGSADRIGARPRRVEVQLRGVDAMQRMWLRLLEDGYTYLSTSMVEDGDA